MSKNDLNSGYKALTVRQEIVIFQDYIMIGGIPHEKINRCLTDINRCLTDIFKI